MHAIAINVKLDLGYIFYIFTNHSEAYSSLYRKHQNKNNLIIIQSQSNDSTRLLVKNEVSRFSAY